MTIRLNMEWQPYIKKDAASFLISLANFAVLPSTYNKVQRHFTSSNVPNVSFLAPCPPYYG